MISRTMTAIAVIVVCAAPTFGQPLIPNVNVDGYTLTTSGFVQGLYIEHNDPSFDLGTTRLMFKLETPTKFGGFATVELNDFSVEEAAFLKEVAVTYKLSDAWTLQAGRFFLAAPWYTTPSPQYLETVIFPREPWRFYGWAVGAIGDLGNDWNLRADIGGRGDVRVDGGDGFEGFQTSLTLQKKVNAKLTSGVSVQYEEGLASGLFAEFLPIKDMMLRGEVYAFLSDGTDSDRETQAGGYALACYEIFQQTELHSQIDYQVVNGDGNSVILTNGIRLWAPWRDSEISFTVDHEVEFAEHETANRLLARIQFRF